MAGIDFVIRPDIVRYVPDYPGLGPVFQALADPTRRAVLERLTLGPASVKELARPFPMALPSFAQHLDVLERAGLVHSRKRGRVRTYALETGPLAEAVGWLTRQRSAWELRLDQLDRFLIAEKENDP
jgi:DNA-binding transcriptional ArsR family regulator